MGEPKAKHGRSAMIGAGLFPIDKSRLPLDILAGVTLAALAIPEVMGYTAIAGMPVITGLYTILLPLLVFAFLGSSRHLVVGADSATAAILAAGLAGLAASGSDQYVALAGLVAIMAAVLLLVARLVGLAFLANFMSRTVLVGFMTGVGIQVALGQVGGMLGIPEGRSVTIGDITFSNTLAKLWSTLENIAEVSWPTVAVTAAVIILIKGMPHITRAVPGALIAVVGSIIVSWAIDLADDGVSTLGPVPGGLPSIGLPDVSWSDVPQLTATAVSIFVLILAQSAATSRSYAAKYGDRFDENVDLVGLSAANLAAGLSGTFVVNGSPTKTQMVDSAGGRSQVAHLTTAVIVGVVLLFLTAPLQYLPNAVLSAVVFLIGLELIDLAGMRRIHRLRRDEFWVALLTAATVVCVGVLQGILVAIVLSLVDHLRRSYHPPTAVISTSGGDDGEGFMALPVAPDARTEDGLVIYRFSAPLYYANAEHFGAEIFAFAASDPPPTTICVYCGAIPDIDMSGSAALTELHGELAERGIRLTLAEVMPEVRDELERYGLIEVIGAEHVYSTIAAAEAGHRAGATPAGPPT